MLSNIRQREVRHRYLFAIEDPFELDHNVARTVTHHGIVAIRDEFRRAWRIITAIGQGRPPEGQLFDAVVEDIAAEEAEKTTRHDSIDTRATPTAEERPLDHQPQEQHPLA